ncbi:DNA-directed RNA polymerase subunit beta [Vagococcus martis]|uniref:DNA-directed RNA polymerase subunit beta n=1 Tax=Vagococcus martis TaxID=1768210 RepID=UPI0009A2C039|nr:DNA-directed RNA polymerase subunit beta [Vagococcus martis]
MNSITKRVLIQVLLVILLIVVLIGLFFLGIFIGYVYVGKGQSSDAFNPATWQHILDFVK